jgi:hypothetical protein
VWPLYVRGNIKIIYLVIQFSPYSFNFDFLITNIFPCTRLSNTLHFYSFVNVVYQFFSPMQSKVQYPTSTSEKNAIVRTPKQNLMGCFILLSSYDFFWRKSLQWARAFSFTKFLDHTQRHTTVGRASLDEWSARRRDLCLTTHNRQTYMPPVGLESAISAGERPQTYVLDRAFTGSGILMI